MNTRTRNFMLGSAAILVTGLCTGLVAYYGGIPGAFARQAGPAELAYMPSNAIAVAYANVGDVMKSDLRERLRAIMPDEDKEKGRHEFQKATGIDIERDIASVVVAVAPDSDGRAPIVAIRGNFDEGRIEALAREHGATVDTSSGVRVIELPRHERRHRSGEADDDEDEAAPAERKPSTFRPALAFVEPGLVLFGNIELVKAGLNRKAGQNLTANGEMMARIEKLDSGANAWAIGRVDALAGHGRLPDQVAAQLPALTWIEAAGHLNGGISGTLRAETRDVTAANNLRDMINGIMAFGRMQSQSKPEIQQLMQAITLGGSGTTVEMTFTIPAELIDAIAPKTGTRTVAMR
jgi:hypothetical protein